MQVEEALARHPGLRVAAAAMPAGSSRAGARRRAGCALRPDFWPDHGGMDGFYMAVLTPLTEDDFATAAGV